MLTSTIESDARVQHPQPATSVQRFVFGTCSNCVEAALPVAGDASPPHSPLLSFTRSARPSPTLHAPHPSLTCPSPVPHTAPLHPCPSPALGPFPPIPHPFLTLPTPVAHMSPNQPCIPSFSPCRFLNPASRPSQPCRFLTRFPRFLTRSSPCPLLSLLTPHPADSSPILTLHPVLRPALACACRPCGCTPRQRAIAPRAVGPRPRACGPCGCTPFRCAIAPRAVGPASKHPSRGGDATGGARTDHAGRTRWVGAQVDRDAFQVRLTPRPRSVDIAAFGGPSRASALQEGDRLRRRLLWHHAL